MEARREERKRAAETNAVPEAAVKLIAKPGTAGDGAAPAAEAADEPAAEARTIRVSEELEWAKDMLSVDRFEEAEKALVAVLRQEPENHPARLLMAVSRIQQGRMGDALVVIDDLLADQPRDEAVLLLAAGAHMAGGAYAKAMDALDRAMKVNPRRPDGYLNMAWLLLEMKPRETDEAELYYRQAVKLGAPRDRDIERRLGIRPE